jgi:hypothetical protein
MSSYQDPIAMPVQGARAIRRATARAKIIAFRTVRNLSGAAREALFAYALTGSALASLAIIAAPHLEVLLRCTFQERG